MIRSKVWVGIFLLGTVFLLAACNVGERIAEQAVEQAIEQVAGEGALATSEAFTSEVATEVAAFATQEAGGEVIQPEAEVETADGAEMSESEEAAVAAAKELVESSQNDANSGVDAGMGNDPLTITAGAGYHGLVTGIQNGGDLFDVYQFQAEPGQIVRVLFNNPAENTANLSVDLGNGDNYDWGEFVPAGGSAEIVMGSSNPSNYRLNISHDGSADALNYTFDLVLESENDAGSAADAGNNAATGLPIEAGVLVQGASIGNATGANDMDCYTFNQPLDDGKMSINVSSPVDQPYESFVGIELYNGAGEFVTSGTSQYGNSYTLEYGVADFESAPAGDYAVCLSSYSFYSYGEYEFT
ncbi:MAG: hypothetical protein AAF902_16475, partial [Chloroflexota bacterium]